MTCQECEIKLGMGEDAGEHLAACPQCRLLAEDLRLNAIAMHEMRPRPTARWAWALAAATAALAIAMLFLRTPQTSAPRPAVHIASAPVPKPVSQGHALPVKHRRPKPAPVTPLRVKMFTSDPDVVIYWIVDKKEGTE